MERIKRKPEIKSTKLRISPVRAKSPLTIRIIATARKIGLNGSIPKIRVRNRIAPTMSIPPSIFTNTIEIAGKRRF